jgi:hypothetical protein
MCRGHRQDLLERQHISDIASPAASQNSQTLSGFDQEPDSQTSNTWHSTPTPWSLYI